MLLKHDPGACPAGFHNDPYSELAQISTQYVRILHKGQSPKPLSVVNAATQFSHYVEKRPHQPEDGNDRFVDIFYPGGYHLLDIYYPF